MNVIDHIAKKIKAAKIKGFLATFEATKSAASVVFTTVASVKTIISTS